MRAEEQKKECTRKIIEVKCSVKQNSKVYEK